MSAVPVIGGEGVRESGETDYEVELIPPRDMGGRACAWRIPVHCRNMKGRCPRRRRARTRDLRT